MAAGIRAGRKGPGSRKAASRFANFIRDKVLADGCADTGCGIKLYRREAFLELPFFTSMHRYLPALFLTYGHEIAYEAVNDRPRLRGASKYTNLGRALIGLYDLVGVSWLRSGRIFRRLPKTYRAPTPPRPRRWMRRGKSRFAPRRVRARRRVIEMYGAELYRWWLATPTTELIWIGVGLAAQLLFSMRFLVQWLATEKARASTIPETFWYFSFFGGLLLLAYACYRVDPVFILGRPPAS